MHAAIWDAHVKPKGHGEGCLWLLLTNKSANKVLNNIHKITYELYQKCHIFSVIQQCNSYKLHYCYKEPCSWKTRVAWCVIWRGISLGNSPVQIIYPVGYSLHLPPGAVSCYNISNHNISNPCQVNYGPVKYYSWWLCWNLRPIIIILTRVCYYSSWINAKCQLGIPSYRTSNTEPIQLAIIQVILDNVSCHSSPIYIGNMENYSLWRWNFFSVFLWFHIASNVKSGMTTGKTNPCRTFPVLFPHFQHFRPSRKHGNYTGTFGFCLLYTHWMHKPTQARTHTHTP